MVTKVLNVAEKNDAAKRIAEILSGRNKRVVSLNINFFSSKLINIFSHRGKVFLFITKFMNSIIT